MQVNQRHACTSSGASLGECRQLPTLARHSQPLCSLVLPPCAGPEWAPRSPGSPAACPSSALSSPHQCLSPGFHLPVPCCAAARLGTDLPYQLWHSLAAHVAKICHSLSFLRRSRPRCWVDSLPGRAAVALHSCVSGSWASRFPLPSPVLEQDSQRWQGWVLTWRDEIHAVFALALVLEISLQKQSDVAFWNMLKSDDLTAQGVLPIYKQPRNPLYFILVLKD